MAKIAVRAVLLPDYKTMGQLTDRFFFGPEACNLDYSVLPLLDSKRLFRFLDRRSNVAPWRAANVDSAVGSTALSTSMIAAMKIAFGRERFVNDVYTAPMFYSSGMACFRNQFGGTCNTFPGLIGNFKGPGPVFTIDAQGAGGDFLAPGTKLVASKGGVIHKYVDQGAFDVLHYPNGNTARDPWVGNFNLGNYPVILGWNPISAMYNHPYYEAVSPGSSMYSTTNGFPGTWGMIKTANIVYQDATYIIFFQANDCINSISRYVPNSTGPADKYHLVAMRKSDGYQYVISPVAANCPTAAMAFGFKAVTTTEGTPQKACVFTLLAGFNATKTFSLNKIIGTTLTNVGNPTWLNYFYGEVVPTQIMENKNASFSTHWKMYFPMAGFSATTQNENALTFQLIRFNKTLLSAPTVTACTLSGIPTEYCSANGDGTKLRTMNTLKAHTTGRYDAVFAAEVYDGSDQYIVYWIGRTRSSVFHTDIDANSYSEMSDQAYRWMLVFKVNNTDDTILTYVSAVPEFKLAKPMYCYVASPDNKYIVMANADGLYCFSWSTTTKGFICTDALALPGIMSLGMDENQTTDKCTVMVEVLQDPTNPEACASSVYQIDFGNYEDVDLRYYNGSTYVTDFGFSGLNLVSDGGGGFNSQTITAEVRVKNKVGAVETAFVSGKQVRLKISGVRETDGVAFIGSDSGNPYQKTITSGTDWTQFQFTIKNPMPGMKIQGEITT